MSFSIDCLTPHPPSPSKRLIHSRRFALSERGSRLPHAPAPRGRRQPRVGKPAQGTSSRRGGVIHRSCPQACAWLWGFVGCRHSTCAQRPLNTTAPSQHPLRQRPAQAATHLDMTSLDTEFWLKIRDNHPISRARPLGHPEAEPPEAATAHSSSPCNLSTVTTRSAERRSARFSPQFCTGSKRICG